MDAAQQTGTGVRAGSHSRIPTSAIAGLGLAVVVGSSLAFSVVWGVITPSGSGAARLEQDRSYDAIENMRGGVVLSSAADHSYDAIENARAGIAVSGAADDHGYDAIENARAGGAD